LPNGSPRISSHECFFDLYPARMTMSQVLFALLVTLNDKKQLMLKMGMVINSEPSEQKMHQNSLQLRQSKRYECPRSRNYAITPLVCRMDKKMTLTDRRQTNIHRYQLNVFRQNEKNAMNKKTTSSDGLD